MNKIPIMNKEQFEVVMPKGWEDAPEHKYIDMVKFLESPDHALLLSDGRITKDFSDLGRMDDDTARWGLWIQKIIVDNQI